MNVQRVKNRLEVVTPLNEPRPRLPHASLCGFCVCAPLSVAASKIFFFLFLASSLYEYGRSASLGPWAKKYISLSAFWLFLCLIAGITGVAPLTAFIETGKTLFYLAFPVAIYVHLKSGSKPEKLCTSYLWLLLIGQTAASLHTILLSRGNFLQGINPPGAVTESGQLALVIPATLALLVMAVQKAELKRARLGALIFFNTVLGALIVFGHWSALFTDEQRYGFLAFGIGLSILSVVATNSESQSRLIKLSVCIVFLVAALFINLKRGPWMGLSISLIIIALMQSRRGLLVAIFSLILVMVTLTPTSERIEHFDEHFSTDGGRADMWKLGFRMTSLYPLGVGLDNAEYMRLMDPFLPESHSHMHSNLINVLVESGWLGFVVFLFWAAIPFKAVFSLKSDSILLSHLAAALAAWHCAGLVEYNFGDSEVRMIALLFTGMILALVCTGQPTLASGSSPRAHDTTAEASLAKGRD